MNKLLSILLFVLMITSCHYKKSYIFNNEPFDKIDSLATLRQLPYCLVLLDSIGFVSATESDNPFITLHSRKAIINYVNVDLESNTWYLKILQPQLLPVSCIFYGGSLIDVIPGASKESIVYLNSVLQKKIMSDYHYNQLYGNKKKTKFIEYEQLIRVKNSTDQRKNDIVFIDSILNEQSGLYLLYLKMQNQLAFNDSAGAKMTAKRIVSFDTRENIVRYSEEIFNAHHVLDSDYNVLTAPRIKVNPSNVNIEHCVLQERKTIPIEVTNVGQRNLVIYDILTSCSCLDLMEENIMCELLPGESYTIGITFTPDVEGIVLKDIIIISNSYSSNITHVPVKANVKKQL